VVIELNDMGLQKKGRSEQHEDVPREISSRDGGGCQKKWKEAVSGRAGLTWGNARRRPQQSPPEAVREGQTTTDTIHKGVRALKR